MEGIRTADALLAKTSPKEDFAKKDAAREARATVDIARIKMDRVEELFIPIHPVSLIVNFSDKINL